MTLNKLFDYISYYIPVLWDQVYSWLLYCVACNVHLALIAYWLMLMVFNKGIMENKYSMVMGSIIHRKLNKD